MKEGIKDCLSCSESLSIAKEDTDKGYDELYCTIKDCVVEENGCCENHN